MRYSLRKQHTHRVSVPVHNFAFLLASNNLQELPDRSIAPLATGIVQRLQFSLMIFLLAERTDISESISRRFSYTLC